MKTFSFARLKIWSEAYRLALAIHKLTRSLPKHEQYELASQLRRSSSSVPANIAEGSGRNSPKEFANFLHIAQGSANETICHCMLARDLGYITEGAANELIEDLDGLRAGIFAYISAIKRSDARSTASSVSRPPSSVS